ncbi:hypothetical protein C7974DRAFT_396153 [Boeremia exigua]|uniref:uncharacterized protein n=1 Tax=Boeremia exigua TaxID=749465 RepID=UPI001E8E5773|nr:uncharacterized protein C7974DRAFT_396153 [Boeremia exigua]KAH6625477.1 hypothetical protein C7974DRAFT_396153 [Boeremia exigua]
MAPIASIRALAQRAAFNLHLPSSEFKDQLTNPGDVFSVLLILGGDVVGRALAQLAGTGLTPVTFSFGWVAYAVTAVVSAVGANKLMPPPDCDCIVINGKSAYSRSNTSWILGRIVRDYESWTHSDVRKGVDQIINERWELDKQNAEANDKGSGGLQERPTQAGLCIAIYRAKPAEPGQISRDALYWSCFAVVVFQLGVAAIPFGIWGDWSILLITFAGIVLAFLSGSLRQWRTEKWSCRRLKKPKDVIITRGNGAQHAIIVRDPGHGLDLESLAAGQTSVDFTASLTTRTIIVLLAVLWVVLLICASGIKTNTWFLLAVGGIGIVQNIVIAGWRRDPSAYGLPLKFEKVISKSKVMPALFAIEEEIPGIGSSMLETFFPGTLRRDEQIKWDNYRDTASARSNAVAIP